MGITVRYNGPPSPGYATDGETWADDLGTEVGRLGSPLYRRLMSGEVFTLDGDGWQLVEQDPEDPAAWAPDAILLDTPDGQRVSLARSSFAVDGERQSVAKIPDVLARVDGNPQLAQLELDAERARGDAARKTLVEQLEQIAAGPVAPIDNAGAPAGQEG